MNRPIIIVILALIFYLFHSHNIIAVSNDNVKSEIITNLSDQGFENIAVVMIGNDVFITYENRLFRHEAESLEKVIEIVTPFLLNYETLYLIPQNKKLPIGTVKIDPGKFTEFSKKEISRNEFISSINYSLTTDSLWQLLKSETRSNKSDLKTDIILFPHVKTRFGDFDNSVRAQLSIIPTIHTTLGKGLSIFAQLILPAYDNLEPETKTVRPGIITVNQTIRLPYNILMSTTIGQFAQLDRYGIDYEHRYGFDFEINKYFEDGIWLIGANAGYTGETTYRDRIWKLKQLNTPTYFTNAEYRIAKYNLSIAVKLGQFIYGDKGIRVDINRQFGEVDIGFYAIFSGNEKNGGFIFSIPIFPPKYYSSPVRIIPASYFVYDYRMRRFPREGQAYETGYKINDWFKRLMPDYINNFLFKNY
ncbi:YjbH domain-containing protein [Bacteroidota bacterium]